MATELIWLGHATWQIESGGKHILLDPFLDENPAATISADEVPADIILVSHGHFDHVMDVVKIAKRTGSLVIANFEICQWLDKQGVTNCQQMNLGGSVTQPFGRVKITQADHSSSFPDGSYAGRAGGFVVTFPEGVVYFACDTGLFGDMRLIGEMGIDLAILPIGDVFTMGPEDAVRAVKLLCPKKVIPTHYNTWPPIEQDAKAWAERVAEQTDATPIVLEPGERISL